MANISLEGSIRTCKIDSGWANKIQSDRFENSSIMVCPPWSGVDSAGRRVCPDSFMTKTAGCNSPDDRVAVENMLRPSYIEYINLDASGIKGDIYNGQKLYGDTMPFQQEGARTNAIKNLYRITGNAGYDLGADVYPRCAGSAYDDAQAQLDTMQRQNQATTESFRAAIVRQNAGMGPRQTFGHRRR